MIGRLLGFGRAKTRAQTRKMLERFNLTDAAERAVKTYSGGMRRRLDLASALIARPRILFLDEPTTGLDPRSRIAMWDVIARLAADGATVLLTTQYLEEADELAHRIAVIDRGRVIAEGTSDQLKAQVGGERIEVVVHDPALMAPTVDALRRVQPGGEAVVDLQGRRVRYPVVGGARVLVDVLRELDASGVAIDDIALRRPTLDDVFLTLTGHAAEPEAEEAEVQAR